MPSLTALAVPQVWLNSFLCLDYASADTKCTPKLKLPLLRVLFCRAQVQEHVRTLDTKKYWKGKKPEALLQEVLQQHEAQYKLLPSVSEELRGLPRVALVALVEKLRRLGLPSA